MIHLLFNVIGTALLFLILKIGMNRVVDRQRRLVNLYQIIRDRMVQEINILLDFIHFFIIPGDDKKVGYRDSYQLKYIGEKVVFNPATAVVEVTNEIERMASLASIPQLFLSHGAESNPCTDTLSCRICHVFRMIADALDIIYSDIVSGLERVADHATNIAFSVLNNDPTSLMDSTRIS